MKRVHLSIPPPLETRAWDRQRQLFHRISRVMCGAFDDFVSRIIRGMRMFSPCIFKNVRGNERRWFKAGSTPCTNAPPLLVLPTQLSSLDALLLLHSSVIRLTPPFLRTPYLSPQTSTSASATQNNLTEHAHPSHYCLIPYHHLLQPPPSPRRMPPFTW